MAAPTRERALRSLSVMVSVSVGEFRLASPIVTPAKGVSVVEPALASGGRAGARDRRRGHGGDGDEAVAAVRRGRLRRVEASAIDKRPAAAAAAGSAAAAAAEAAAAAAAVAAAAAAAEAAAAAAAGRRRSAGSAGEGYVLRASAAGRRRRR